MSVVHERVETVRTLTRTYTHFQLRRALIRGLSMDAHPSDPMRPYLADVTEPNVKLEILDETVTPVDFDDWSIQITITGEETREIKDP